MLNETLIRCFLTLAETLNFTRAAARLYLSQQAVSKNIRQLEKELGFALFIRDSHSVILTEEGRQCCKLFSSLFRQYQEELLQIRRSYSITAEKIVIGLQEWLDFGLIPDSVQGQLSDEGFICGIESIRRHPGQLAKGLLERKIDLAVIYGRYLPKAVKESSGLNSEEIMRFPIYMLASKDSPKNKPGATYRDFLDEPFLVDIKDADPKISLRLSTEMLRDMGLPPVKIKPVPNRSAAISAALQGEGVALSSDLIRFTRTTNLLQFPFGYNETLECVWHADPRRAELERYAYYFRQACQTKDVINQTL